MIKPVGINFTSVSKQQKQPQYVKYTEEASPIQMELSGAEVGRAMLANTGINFKGTLEPVDVTDKLNKKVEGKSHLELPDLKVFDYPDTNLRVFVDRKELADDGIELRFALSKKYSPEKDVLKEGVIIQILNNSLMQELEGVTARQASNKLLAIEGGFENSRLENLEKINKILTNPNFTEEQLNKAKEVVASQINSEDMKQVQEGLSAFEGWRSNAELLEMLEKLTVEEISSYYTNCLKEGKANMFLTLNAGFYEENSSKLLKFANKGLENKFVHPEENIESEKPPIVRNSLKLVSAPLVNRIELHYPRTYSDRKEDLIGEIATLLFFMTKIEFSSDVEFTGYRDVYNLPSPPDGSCSFVLEPANLLPQEKIEEVLPTFEAVVVYGCQEFDEGWEVQENSFNSVKDYAKELLKERLENPETSNWELYDYGSSIFEAYEMYDAITLDDIKDYLNKNMVKPIIIAKRT